MAARPVPLTLLRSPSGHWAGWASVAMVAGLVLLPLGAVVWRAGGGTMPGPSDWAALRFTIWQALLSAIFSVALAIPVARALARRRFIGRGLLITLMGAPFILPVIVAVLGLLAVFGNSGFINHITSQFGMPQLQIYGLHGVVLAHVFFNLPLATRLLLQGWEAIPAERFRLAGSLGFGPRDVFVHLEWPMLRTLVPGTALIIFAICLASFAVALTLGGGPRATTVELAIYQAFRFDFDLGRAAVLSLIQMGLVVLAALTILRLVHHDGFARGLDRPVRRWDADAWGRGLIDISVLACAGLFLVLPIAAVVLRGLPHLTDLPPQIWRAAVVSVITSLAACLVTIVWALTIAHMALRYRLAEVAGLLGMAASPLVIGTGLFLLINPVADPARFALFITVLVNALAALPFALRILLPALHTIMSDYGRLADSLGLAGFARLRWLVLPRLRRPLGFAAGLSAALSMGDLGVIALFADPERATLPLIILRLMGAYQMDAAAGAAVVLLALTVAMFWLFDRGGRHGDDA